MPIRVIVRLDTSSPPPTSPDGSFPTPQATRKLKHNSANVPNVRRMKLIVAPKDAANCAGISASYRLDTSMWRPMRLSSIQNAYWVDCRRADPISKHDRWPSFDQFSYRQGLNEA